MLVSMEAQKIVVPLKKNVTNKRPSITFFNNPSPMSHFSFFTIILRCAIHYKMMNYDWQKKKYCSVNDCLSIPCYLKRDRKDKKLK